MTSPHVEPETRQRYSPDAADPRCPECGVSMERVEQGSPRMLNADQYDAIKPGDWFCRHCPGDRGKSGYLYLWNREVTLHDRRERNRRLVEDAPAPTPTEGRKKIGTVRIDHGNQTASIELEPDIQARIDAQSPTEGDRAERLRREGLTEAEVHAGKLTGVDGAGEPTYAPTEGEPETERKEYSPKDRPFDCRTAVVGHGECGDELCQMLCRGAPEDEALRRELEIEKALRIEDIEDQIKLSVRIEALEAELAALRPAPTGETEPSLIEAVRSTNRASGDWKWLIRRLNFWIANDARGAVLKGRGLRHDLKPIVELLERIDKALSDNPPAPTVAGDAETEDELPSTLSRWQGLAYRAGILAVKRDTEDAAFGQRLLVLMAYVEEKLPRSTPETGNPTPASLKQMAEFFDEAPACDVQIGPEVTMTPGFLLRLIASALEDALANPEAGEQPRHVCGLQGYDPMKDPPCPGCAATPPETGDAE